MMRSRRAALPVAIAVFATAAALNSAAQPSPRADGHGRAKLDEYNRALGVECAHCHVADAWADDSKPAKATARQMIEMVPQLNAKLRGVGEVSCWTCHRGQPQPSRLPQEAIDKQLADWPAALAAAPQSTKQMMAMYSASTGLRCAQCHEVGDWKRAATDKMRMVPRMLAVFGVMQPLLPATARPQCFTCHKGSNKPETK